MPLSDISAPAPPVVALRTPVWNDAVARLARRLRHYAQGARLVLLADTTHGPLPGENFTKLRHDTDFSAFGLPAFPAQETLRFNTDYPLYLLRRDYPDAAHYAMLDHDTAVNIDITAILQRAAREGIDLIAHEITDDITDTAQKYFARPLRAFTPCLIASARAVDIMLRERRRIAAQAPPDAASPASAWPCGAALIPSAAALLDGAVLRELGHFADLSAFAPGPAQHIDDPAANRPGTICHPVWGAEMFIARRVREAGLDEILDPQSALQRQLDFCDPAKFAKILLDRVKRARDLGKLHAFVELARARNWPVRESFDNLALFRPALISSAWGAGDAPDLAALAGGANNGIIDGGFGFHTDIEDGPWWQVDLQREVVLSHVRVFNRLDQAQRCRHLRLSASLDGVSWQVLVEKRDDRVFGGADGYPLDFDLRSAPVARFVRLTNLERNYFHLDEVQVKGTARPDKP